MNPDFLPHPTPLSGHPLRGLWALDPGVRFPNHGSFGAAPQRLTFVDNATVGANAVLRWRAGGERIVIADCAYPGVKNAARFVAERHGLTLTEALARVFG